ncbi:putative methyltransferase-domain-containing protein [Mycena sp. CBHHK59/15]|nr:putative methyltransferase-domain-containing protein [Mycena sp. CBHHK59/15]
MSFSPDPIHEDLFQMLRGYSSLILPNHLHFPSHLQAQSIHDFLVNHVLMSAHFQLYPPSDEYQKSFWKWVIPRLENRIASEAPTFQPELDLEVDSRIYEHYLELLPSNSSPHGVPGQSPPSQSYITHFWRPDAHTDSFSSAFGLVDLAAFQTTTLLESRTMIESGTTGLRTWLASLVLAQYLVLHPGLIQRKRILELGSGTGFLGTVVASLQLQAAPDAAPPGTLWMTDINDVVLSRCRDNIQLPCNLSSAHPDVRCCFLDWSAALDADELMPLTSLLSDEIDADLILGADIVFDPDLIPVLVAVLCLALQAGPSSNARPKCALIALTKRNPATMQKFLDAIRDGSLALENIDDQLPQKMFMEPVEGGSDANNGVTILKITLTCE